MIARYTRPEMAELWSLESRYRAWLEVELAVCEAWHEQGVISVEDMAAIRDKAAINVERLEEIEATNRRHCLPHLAGRKNRPGGPVHSPRLHIFGHCGQRGCAAAGAGGGAAA